MRRAWTFVFLSAVVLLGVWGVACGGGGSGSNGTTFVPPPSQDASVDATMPPPISNDSGSISLGDAPAPSTILILSPNDSTLVVDAGGSATTQFTAVFQGTTTPIAATWSVDRPLVGTIDNNGLFTASGSLGGVVTIAAQTALAHGATTLTVQLHASRDPDDAGAALGGVLRDGGAADSKFRWLYPYDQTVFPRGLAAPTLQWDGEPATALRVHVKSSTLDYEAFFGPSSPPRADFTADDWTMLTQSAAPGDPLVIEATKLSASGVTGPTTETWTIAQGSLKGSVYYNTYDSPLNNGNGAVMRIRPGEDATILLGGCHVCHAVSANGSTLVAMGADEDPKPDAGYTGDDPYFYRQSASFDLGSDAGLIHDQGDPSLGFGALSPDGTRLLSCGSMAGDYPPNIPGFGNVGNPDGGSGDRASRLYDPRDGGVLKAPGFDGVVNHALMPAFSPDGTRVVFNHFDEGHGRSLAVMNFAAATNTFSNLVDLVDGSDAGADAGTPYLGWPYFLPDSQSVVYNTVNVGDYATWNDYGNEAAHVGDLFLADLATHTQTSLAAANGLDGGVPTLPYGTAEAHLNYEPTVLPVAVGGYYWVVFTSRREYGNTITDAHDPGHPDGGAGPFEAHPATRKKLWVAAIDLAQTPGKDPSHPAFYLPGQEPLAGNMRGFWALDACVQNGTSCGSGDECCSGFCRQFTGADGGTLLSCVPQPQGCSQEFEKCTASSDCCGAAQGYLCLDGHCAQPAPK
jgi:hypothetical protein